MRTTCGVYGKPSSRMRADRSAVTCPPVRCCRKLTTANGRISRLCARSNMPPLPRQRAMNAIPGAQTKRIKHAKPLHFWQRSLSSLTRNKSPQIPVARCFSINIMSAGHILFIPKNNQIIPRLYIGDHGRERAIAACERRYPFPVSTTSPPTGMQKKKCHQTTYALYTRGLQKNIKSFNIAIY